MKKYVCLGGHDLYQPTYPPAWSKPNESDASRRFQGEICDAYSRWMVDLRGLAESTVLCRCGEARHFLGWLAERANQEGLTGLTIADVDAYMKDRAGSLRRVTIKQVSNMLRTFLRWLHFSSLTSRDLSSAVIAPSIYAFENIPCALRVDDVQTVLAVTKEDSSPKGLRDYAVLQLLAT